MPQAVQGMVIGLLISLLVGLILGFYLRQSRVNELSKALKTSQGREQGLQQEHEERLRAATTQLQQDYEAQLADKIERYQRQYEAQLQQLEAEYEARQNLIPISASLPSLEAQDPSADSSPAWDTAPISAYEAELRQQYEARLKENTYKIQQAYEQYLRESLATAREAQQQEYDQRLAEAIARYQDEVADRLAAALKDQETALAQGHGATSAVEDGDETEVQERLATLEAELRIDYDRRLADRIEQYQDEMSQRIAQLEEEFAARLQMAQAAQPADEPPPPPELPASDDLEARLQADYDARLAAVVARHQDELTERLQALTDEYEARLQMAQASDEVSGAQDTADREHRLRQEIEAQLRADYDLKLAAQLEQVRVDLNQRAQDFEDGFIATMDPFVDPAIDAEALEDSSLTTEALTNVDRRAAVSRPDADPFPDLETFSDFPLPAAAASPEEVTVADEDNLDSEAGRAAADVGRDGAGLEGVGLGESLGRDELDDLSPVDLENTDPDDIDLDFSSAEAGASSAGVDSALSLDDLDLSALSDDDLVDRLGEDEDIFDLETLAKRAGVDLEELNNLLNQPDPATAEIDETIDPFGDEHWNSPA